VVAAPPPVVEPPPVVAPPAVWHSRRRSRRGVTKVSLLGGRESASEGLTDTDGYQILAGIRYRSVSMEAQ
jgi:hypothetical protein